MHHGGQPMTMFAYACHKAGIDMDKINIMTLATGQRWIRPFGLAGIISTSKARPRNNCRQMGKGLLWPPLEPQLAPVHFQPCLYPGIFRQRQGVGLYQSLCSCEGYLAETPAAEIAAVQKPLFPAIDEAVLAIVSPAIKAWVLAGPIDITSAGYEAMLDIFAFDDKIKTRYAYDQICVPPPKINL